MILNRAFSEFICDRAIEAAWQKAVFFYRERHHVPATIFLQGIHMSNVKEKMHTGELYDPFDEEIYQEQMRILDRLREFNATRSDEMDKRRALMEELFAEVGEGTYIEPPLYANWGGKFLHLGKNVYANFHLTLVDDTDIYVGDSTFFGPNVTLACAGHPLDPELRATGWQYNLPIHIGNHCWLGAGVIVMPGVTIGDGSVIGAGSIVTKDIPAGSLAYGNPCRVVRAINEHDKEFYYRDRKVPQELKDLIKR